MKHLAGFAHNSIKKQVRRLQRNAAKVPTRKENLLLQLNLEFLGVIALLRLCVKNLGWFENDAFCNCGVAKNKFLMNAKMKWKPTQCESDSDMTVTDWFQVAH